MEDEVELGPARSTHDTVRRVGNGAYSHWGDWLYFSSSDNSDPTANGRIYSVFLTAEGSQNGADHR
jgi:hypothetical protein